MAHTVGLVTDNPLATMQLRTILAQLRQPITYTLTADQVFESSPLRPTLWVVVSERAAEVFDRLNEWSHAPVFLADDMPSEDNRVHYEQWKNNLTKKLSNTFESLPTETEKTIPISIEAIDAQSFKEVWVLASSLGGPEAVRVFLANIHPDLPVAFVYTQHIEANFDKMLPNVVGKNSRFKVQYAADGECLRRGTVMVYPSHNLTQVDGRGRIHIFADKTWDKPYTPNIDQAIENIADHFVKKMGVIMFSGMCDDGANTSIALKDKIPVWAQKPSECVCPAMPEAVIKKEAVKYIGTAQELAKQLNNRHGKF
jgi:chemosensory pili system protein ChpB (putative protein-glutamate methylesterase)